MKLRTQLVIVFLLLSILPLSGIVLFSYTSSQRAFREAVGNETLALAHQMDTRVAGIREEVGRRVDRLGGLPIGTLVAASDQNSEAAGTAAATLAAELGDSAEFLDRIEWSTQSSIADAARELGRSDPGAPVTPVAPVPETPPAAPVAQVPDPPDPPETPHMETFVIEIPRIEVGEDGQTMIVGSDSRTITAPEAFGVIAAQREVDEAIARAKQLVKESKREIVLQQEEMLRSSRERARNREVRTVLVHDGSEYGVLKAQIREEAIVKKVLAGAAPETDDIAFAIDDDGTILTASEEDREKLSGLDIDAIKRGDVGKNENWVIATLNDEETGLEFGIARPVRDSLRQMRATAINNFAWGLGLVALALFGIVPIANHLTRDIERVMDGVDRIGQGDLDSPVQVRSNNEIGRLASAFNRMSVDLKDHQRRLLDEERNRQEREVEQRVLEAEYKRKSRELEEARNFQLSLLPDAPPTHPDLDIAVLVRTATEVGGDYYDYHANADGSLTLALGDATGHGAKAGTMVTVVKSLFAGKAEGSSIPDFLDESNRTIRLMGLERMAMALTVARFERGRLSLASAGMPPALVHRFDTGTIEELQCEAPPLGSLAYAYQSLETEIRSGDVVLLMTDGFPELENAAGEPLGYEATERLFQGVASREPAEILQAFADEADRWTAGQPPSDDMTFLAVRVVRA